MSLFSVIGGWFHKQENSLEKIFKRVEPIAQKVEGLVAQASTEIGKVANLTQDQALVKAKAFLDKATGTAATGEQFVKDHAGSIIPTILHYAVVYAAKSLHSDVAKAAASDVDTAVQLAYSEFSQSQKAA